MSQVILLSLTASLNPTLVGATTVMLLLDKPARLMLGYLLGAYVTSITLGLVIVFSASNSSTTNTTQNTLSPTVDIALGLLALVGAWVDLRHRFPSSTSAARRQLLGGTARRLALAGASLAAWFGLGFCGGGFLSRVDAARRAATTRAPQSPLRV
jgi:Sap, sulfolipid-1-addressing protein